MVIIGSKNIRKKQLEEKLLERCIRMSLPVCCWVSNICRKPSWYGGDWYMQEAHIGSGSGQMLREKDTRATVILCPLLHNLHVADRKKIPLQTIHGREYPTIDCKNLLWVKETVDPEGYDKEYLKKVWKYKLPDPEPLDEFWMGFFQGAFLF